MPKTDPVRQNSSKSRGVRGKKTGSADWGSATGAILIRAIAAAASTGGALRFGYSRDGGAYAIGIYGDGDPYTEFVAPSEDIDEFLDDVISLFESIADDRATAQNGARTQKQA